MKKVYKIIISAVSLAVIIGLIFIIKNHIDIIKPFKLIVQQANSQETINYYNKYIIRYSIYIVINIISILLIGFFNFLLWFKKVFCFTPLTAEQKAEREKILCENKKKKLQEKLNKLN